MGAFNECILTWGILSAAIGAVAVQLSVYCCLVIARAATVAMVFCYQCVPDGSSSLEWIGVSCFERTGVEDVSILNGVRELRDEYFKGSLSLRQVRFGFSLSLDCIGIKRIQATRVEDVICVMGASEGVRVFIVFFVVTGVDWCLVF